MYACEFDHVAHCNECSRFHVPAKLISNDLTRVELRKIYSAHTSTFVFHCAFIRLNCFSLLASIRRSYHFIIELTSINEVI